MKELYPSAQIFKWKLQLVSDVLWVISKAVHAVLTKLFLLANCFSNLFTEVEIWYSKNFKIVLELALER